MWDDTRLPRRAAGLIINVAAAVFSAAAIGAEGAEPKSSIQEILSQPVGPLDIERIDYGGLLERVAVEIHTPIQIDNKALQPAGYAPGQSVRIHEKAQTADKLLTATLKSISRENRFCFSVTTDQFGRIELLFTTRHAAKSQGLLVLPDSVPVDLTAPVVSLAFEKNTLENGLLLICLEIGAHLRLDVPSLKRAGIPLTRLFGVEIERRNAAAALDEMLRKFDPERSVGYVFTANADRKPIVVVSTRERLAEFGPWPDVRNLDDIAEKAPPSRQQAWQLHSPLRWVADAMAKPVEAESRSVTLAAALDVIAQAAGLPIDLAAVDFEVAGLNRRQTVTFDPRGREVRAVLYDVLWQADPDREGRLVACVERRKDDTFALLVTTRLAANSAGRSLLTDYNLSPDDIKSGKD
jgi:hypothetical protein